MTVKTFDDEIIVSLEGSSFKENYVIRNNDKEEVLARDLTIKNAIVGALQNQLKGDDTLLVKQIFDNMVLADRIYKGGEVELRSEDITNIKERVAKAWPQPIVLYRVIQFLEE